MSGRKHGKAPGIAGHAHGFAGLCIASAAFSPLSLGPTVWLRSDLGITIGTGVQKWADQSGNGHDVIQNTGANQPAYNATDAAYNNLPTLQTTAVTQNLAVALALPQAFSIFVVGQFSTSGGIVVGCGANTDGFLACFGGNQLQTFAGAGSAIDAAANFNTAGASLGILNGASSFAGSHDWVTGGTTGGAGTSSFSTLTVFGSTTLSSGTVGKMAELIILPRAATAGDKTSLSSYFFSRYGFTVS